MANEARRFRRRKKEDIFVYGYKIDQATDVTPAFDRSEETFHIYGADSPDSDVQHNFTNLTIQVIDKYTNNAILDLITNQNPDQDSVKQYRVEQLVPVSAWANVKDALNTRYVKSWFVSGWVPGMPLPAGNANEKANFQFVGQGDLARQFQGAWITARKVVSGVTVGMGINPYPVPDEDNVYAIGCVAITQLGSSFFSEEVEVSAGMVSSTGIVTFAEINRVASHHPVTHAMIIFLQTGAGVWPLEAATPHKLRQ